MTMKRRIAAVIYILTTFALASEMSINVYARDNNERRTKEKIGGFRKNICDINDRESEIHCYCRNKEPRNSTDADCWVLNGGIPNDNPIWQSFESQPFLQILAFTVREDNFLGHIPTEAFLYLPRLSEFAIRYGKIADVTPFAFANLTYLKVVDLSENQIENLQKYSFAHLPNITTLSLKKNKIINIDAAAFYDLPKLQNLELSKNNITTIRNGTFQHTFSLLELELNENKIYYLNQRTFDGLANLRKLDLRKNRIQNLTALTFVELRNLQELLLGKNDLRYISERAFHGMSLLHKLSLYDNKLVSLPSNLFEGVKGVSSLDLRSNELYALTFDNIKPILDNLKPQNSSLLVEGNNFVCDCGLKWMYSLRNETQSQNTRDSLDRVTCKMDPSILNSAYNKMPDAKDKHLDNNQQIVHAGLIIETLNDKINVTEKKTLPRDLSKDDGIRDLYKDEISKKSVKWNVLKISADTPPCPKEVIKATEVPAYIVDPVIPVQNEMKTYKSHETNSGYINLRASFGFAVVWSICFGCFFT